MGEYLLKGFYGTIKAFFDEEETGITQNLHVSRNNRETTDNSITTNILARKAHAEILDAKPLNPAKSISKQNTIDVPQISNENDAMSEQETEALGNTALIESLFGDYQKQSRGKDQYRHPEQSQNSQNSRR